VARSALRVWRESVAAGQASEAERRRFALAAAEHLIAAGEAQAAAGVAVPRPASATRQHSSPVNSTTAELAASLETARDCVAFEEALRLELQPPPISKLGRRSAKAGANRREVDRAMDAADVKATLIDLIISKHSRGIDSNIQTQY
jgi:hypothetical protein